VGRSTGFLCQGNGGHLRHWKEVFDVEMNSQLLRYIQHLEPCVLLSQIKQMISFDMQLCKQTTYIGKNKEHN